MFVSIGNMFFNIHACMCHLLTVICVTTVLQNDCRDDMVLCAPGVLMPIDKEDWSSYNDGLEKLAKNLQPCFPSKCKNKRTRP